MTFKVMNVGYLNSVPYRALNRSSNIAYRIGPPSHCAAALLHHDLDLSLLPIVSILKHGLYEILPYGIIADGPVESVLLLSEEPFEELSQIIIDASSETSVILLKTLLAEYYPNLLAKIDWITERPDKILKAVKGKVGALVIGDLAFINSLSFPHSLDLSREWRLRTGLPFLFAAWAFRPDALSQEQIEVFKSQADWGIENRDALAREWANSTEFNPNEAARYVNEVIQYRMTSEVENGIEKFIELGSKHGFLPANPNRKKAALEIVQNEKHKVKPLSVAEAIRVVSSCSLSELSAMISERRKANLPTLTRRIFRLNITRVSEDNRPAALLSDDQIFGLIRNISENGLLVLDSKDTEILDLDYFEEILGSIRQRCGLPIAALSIFEAKKMAAEYRQPLEQIFSRLLRSGLEMIGGDTGSTASGLLHGKDHNSRDQNSFDPSWAKVMDYISDQRLAAKVGLKTITHLKLHKKQSIENWAIHLYHLRQLQEQTQSIVAHIVDAELSESRMYIREETPENYFRALALSHLMLDNVETIGVSPIGFGSPVADVMKELTESTVVVEL